MASIQICYLCGERLTRPYSKDHVPPQQVFASDIRKKRNDLQLVTLPTHAACNRSYSADEEYFVASFAPLAHDSVAGRAMRSDLWRKAAHSQGHALFKKILREFDSPIVLPRGMRVRKFEGDRVRRVLWKIVRGLYFMEKRLVLPEDRAKAIWISGPSEDPPQPELWPHVAMAREHGRWPGVFAYKYVELPEGSNFSVWGMLFWDRIIGLVATHSPDCACHRCAESPDPAVQMDERGLA